MATGDEDSHQSASLTSDTVRQMLASDAPPPSSRPLPNRSPVDFSRWSDAYSSARSRSSSVGNSTPGDNGSSPKLQEKSSYDIGWQSVEERDENVLSEDETDDENLLVDPEQDEKEEERTSAVVLAEEGRGLIVQGEGLPIVQLNVQSGEHQSSHSSIFFTFPTDRDHPSIDWLIQHT